MSQEHAEPEVPDRVYVLPAAAAWRHRDARDGFEVLFAEPLRDGGVRFHGSTTAVEEGVAWVVGYEIEVDERWHTRRARVTGRSPSGERSLEVLADGDGNWIADGVERPQLAGCLDVDLESSAFTNALPMHRLSLAPGAAADAPAAYIRADGLAIERLEQHYERIGDRRYDYRSPAFDFHCELTYDEHGLVLDYPGIAVRVF